MVTSVHSHKQCLHEEESWERGNTKGETGHQKVEIELNLQLEKKKQIKDIKKE